MARGLNKVMLIGHLGNDPEVRVLSNGTTVANFSIATNEYYRDQNGEQKERTEWHRVVVYGKLAEVCRQYLKKGKQVYVEGRLQTRTWEKEGKKNYITEIICSEMQMLGSRGDGEVLPEEPKEREDIPIDTTAPLPHFPKSVPEPDGGAGNDDLPF